MHGRMLTLIAVTAAIDPLPRALPELVSDMDDSRCLY